jgi:hypothetical protein
MQRGDIDEHDVVTALAGFDGLWETLFPAEQARTARDMLAPRKQDMAA